jgi:hypothetical protein
MAGGVTARARRLRPAAAKPHPEGNACCKDGEPSEDKNDTERIDEAIGHASHRVPPLVEPDVDERDPECEPRPPFHGQSERIGSPEHGREEVVGASEVVPGDPQPENYHEDPWRH